MKKFLQKRLNNEKGLTLVELLAVIVILGIIAAIAIPSIGGIIDNSRIKAVKADAQNILSAANMYFAENNDENDKKVTLEALKDENFIDNAGSFVISENVYVDKVSGGNKFTGTGGKGKSTVTINGATSKDITDSKNDTTVGAAPTSP